MDTNIAGSTVVDQRNSFLRGELATAETYRQALEKVKEPRARAVPSSAQACHSARAAKLSDEVTACGGKPAEGSGAWGSLAKMVEGAAKSFGDAAAIAVLEEGEVHGLHDYRDGGGKLDAATQQWFQTEIMSKQQQTHAQVSRLKHSMSA